MTEITLVRHGETDWNKDGIIQGRFDIPLNDTGIRQAENTMKHLQNIRFNQIFCSPLIRTKQTAMIIAKGVGYTNKIEEIPAFIERDFGRADGKPVQDYYPLVLTGAIEDMETDEEIEARVMNGLHQLANKHLNGRLLVVCHSHVIKAALHAINPDQYTYQTRLMNGSVTTLRFDHQKQSFTIKDIINDFS